jgi:type I restriction enzyme, S subunit
VRPPWPEVPLTQVADLVRGVSYPKTDSRDEAGLGYVPVLRATNIQDARLVLERDLVHVAEANVAGEQRLRVGDIVVATSSGSKHLVGKSALLHSQWNGSFGAFCAGIRPKRNIESRYLAYFLQSPRYWKEIGKKALGVNINNLRRGDLESLLLPLPPVDDQRRIVAELEKQFSRLDEAVANLKRVKANLKRFQAAVLKAAADGKLNGGANKIGWRDALIGEVGQVISGLTKSPKREALPRKMPYLRVANVYANELRLEQIEYIGVAEKEVEKLLLQRGDLLVVEGNGSPDQIGRVALWDGSIPDCVHQNHLIKVRLAADVLPQWALNWLLSPDGRREIERVSSSTAGLHTLSTGKISRLPIPVPPLAEQRRIVAEVDRRLSIVREVEAEVNANLKRAERLRQATLARAFCAGDPSPALP